MDKIKKDRLKELQKKSELSEAEETELDSLVEEKNSETIEGVIDRVITKSGIFNATPKIEITREEVDKETPGMKLHKQLSAIYQHDILGRSFENIKMGSKTVNVKTADPMIISTPADGGYLVPTITTPGIMEYLHILHAPFRGL